MVARWVEVLTGPLDQKKQYRQAKARLAALPEPYRTTASAVSRYLIHCSGITDGETIVAMVTGLADLWERAALDGTPVREIIGEDPVEFAETFAQAYGGKNWIDKERRRLIAAVQSAERAEQEP